MIAARRGTGALVALVLIAAAAQPAGAQATAADTAVRIPDARALSWFSGCWALRRGALVTEERWTSAAGGAMLGTSRSVRNDSLRSWEFVFLGPVEGRLSYVARPSGQTGATFPAIVANDTLAIFEQAAHDFPQRIVYRRGGTDSLLAYIEGPMNGQTRRIEYRYGRVRCDER